MRKIFILIGSALLSVSVMAQSKLSAYSMYALDEVQATEHTGTHNAKVLKTVTSTDGIKYIDAFIRLEKDFDLNALQDAGVEIGVVAGDCLTARIPLDLVEEIAEMEMVKRIEVARTARLLNANSRVSTNHANTVNGVEGGTSAYTGKGVIYGTVDAGIDFNHANFRNEDGSSRIIAAYLPSDNTGTKITGRVIDLTTFDTFRTGTYPGSFFLTEEAIKGLTTDLYNESHGTHTMGSAVGGYNGNYPGFAPEATIIACGTNDLSSTNLVNSAAYIFEKAKELEMPVVINYSIGYNLGKHDGTDVEAYMFDQLIAEQPEGRIICIASGNEGGDNMHLTHSFNTTDPAKTFILDWYSPSETAIETQIDIWSKNPGTDLQATISVVDASTGATIYATTATCNKSKTTVTADSNFKKYFYGTTKLYFYEGGSDDCDNIFINLSGTLKSSTYRLCLTISSTQGDVIHAWTDDYAVFASNNKTGFITGDANMSINTMACGNRTISVGAYQATTKITDIDGYSHDYGGKVGQLAYFSSYGPTFDGRQKPEILAPGLPVISSVSNYDKYYVGYSADEVVCDKVTANGRTNYWGAMSGTSMSTPIVSGIIATWLQADPTLTAERIIDVFRETAISDSYTTDTQKCGFGKIDSYNGLKKILESSAVEGSLNDNAPLTRYAGGMFTIYAPTQEHITLNIYTLNGALAATTSSATPSEELAIDMSNLAAGAYIVNAIGSSLNYTTKVIVK